MAVAVVVALAVVVWAVTERAQRDDDARHHDGAGRSTPGPGTAPAPTSTDPTAADPTGAPGSPSAEPTIRPVDRFCLAGREPGVEPDGSDGTDGIVWRRDLDERFDTLDRSRWNVRDRTRLDHESSYLLARNVSTRNGKLAIRAAREAVGGRSFTSGFIDTNGRYALPDTFRMEVRVKVPMERGMWAAVWLRPADRSGGEIDLVETTHQKGTRPRFHHTIHTDYGRGHQSVARRFSSAELGDRRGTRWHTYTIQKTPGLMVMWIDGQPTAAFCPGSPGWYDDFYDAGKTWSLRINLQVGGWGGEPDATTDWSGDRTTLLVDYVKTWVPRDRSAGDGSAGDDR
ncbi:hypothetical protein GCM10009788_35770 [Nocardioides humi]|uniref:GH16 domain-containing protein n=2 Tax=Nocardioides humi TaxID=449461 RepID=A0ABN2AYF3_9ACTN